MTKTINRRQFIALSGLAGTATAISGCTINLQTPTYLEPYVIPPEEALPGQKVMYASACSQCAAGCGIVVRTSNGRAIKVEGNPQHPLNRGKSCARGQSGLEVLYNPDRLQNAVRQSQRGTKKFDPITWDQALTQLTDRVKAAKPGGCGVLRQPDPRQPFRHRQPVPEGVGRAAARALRHPGDLRRPQDVGARGGADVELRPESADVQHPAGRRALFVWRQLQRDVALAGRLRARLRRHARPAVGHARLFRAIRAADVVDGGGGRSVGAGRPRHRGPGGDGARRDHRRARSGQGEGQPGRGPVQVRGYQRHGRGKRRVAGKVGGAGAEFCQVRASPGDPRRRHRGQHKRGAGDDRGHGAERADGRGFRSRERHCADPAAARSGLRQRHGEQLSRMSKR